jgi:hypothetical protein
MKMTLRRGSLAWLWRAFFFQDVFPGLLGSGAGGPYLALGAYRRCGRAAGRAAGRTPGRAAGATVAAAVASAAVAVVAPTRVLAVLIALAVGIRDDVMEPANERPVAFRAAAAVTAVFRSESRSRQ